MNKDKLGEHIYSTYTTLRRGMWISASIFPILLWSVGHWIYGIPLADSMSDYYFETPINDASKSIFPMRSWFVGFLFAIGLALYLYKGFSTKENILLNIAGGCAIGVALTPMYHKNFPIDRSFSILPTFMHGTFAVLLFLCIAAVSISCSKDTIYLLNNDKLIRKFKIKYKTCAAFMILSPAAALAISLFARDLSKYTYFVELAGIWAFAYYWYVKSDELSLSYIERNALK